MSKNQVTPPNPEKNKKLSKRTKIFVVIGLLCIPLIIFGLGSIDASPDDYSAVTPTERAAPLDQENAIFHMNLVTDFSSKTPLWIEKLHNHYVTPEESPFHIEHQWDQAYWGKVLEDNKADLDLLTKAYKAPSFYVKAHYDPSSSANAQVSCISKNRLYTVYILNLIYNQQWQQAIDAIKLQQEHAKIFIQGSQNFIELLVGLALNRNSDALINLLLELETTPHQTIQDCISLLQSPCTPMLKTKTSEIFKHGFMGTKAIILSDLLANYDAFGSAELHKIPYCSHKNRMVNKMAEITKQFISFEKLRAPQIHSELQKMQLSLERNKAPWRLFLPNGVGNTTITMNSPIIGRKAINIYLHQIYNELFLLKAAARLHQQEHGGLPNDIQDLYSYIGGPIYDPMQPPLTPYQYSKANGRAWSIGDNFVDDGGSEDSIITNNDGQGTDYAIDLFYPKAP